MCTCRQKDGGVRRELVGSWSKIWGRRKDKLLSRNDAKEGGVLKEKKGMSYGTGEDGALHSPTQIQD